MIDSSEVLAKREPSGILPSITVQELILEYLGKDKGESFEREDLEVAERDTNGTGDESRTRFLLYPRNHIKSGIRGRVQFFTLKDRRTDNIANYVVKENEGISSADSYRVTDIEARILQELRRKGEGDSRVNIVPYCGHDKNYIMLEFVDGETLEEHVASNDGRLSPKSMFALTESMVVIAHLLTNLVDSNYGMKSYLTDRRIKLVTNSLNREGDVISADTVESNFHGYRIMAELGSLAPEYAAFLRSYDPISKNIRRDPFPIWMGKDHPRNRIVVHDGPILNNLRYDFNNIQPGGMGEEFALLVNALGGFEDASNATLLTNLGYAAIAMRIKASIEDGKPLTNRLDEEDVKETVELFKDSINEYGARKKIEQWYELDARVLQTVTSMYAAIVHRLALNAVQMFSCGRTKKAFEATRALEFVGSRANSFCGNATNEQRKMLIESGYSLRLDTNPIVTYLTSQFNQ